MCEELTKAQIDEAIREEKRAYSKRWRAENKDKVAASNARYWRKRAEQKLKAEQEAANNGKVSV